LQRLVGAAARLARRRPKAIIALWLVLIVGCVAFGSAAGTKSLTSVQSEVGQSAQADKLLDHHGLRGAAVESILIRSANAARTRAATNALEARIRALPQVATVVGPEQSKALSRQGGRTVLVQATLRGDPDNADDHVPPLLKATEVIQHTHPGTTLQESGDGSQNKAIGDLINRDLGHAELLSLPITLIILVLAFGALVAAFVPLLLGLTAVAGSIGALGFVSQLIPNSDSTSAVVVLIGLAVGVDYSLFYIRREREERHRGRPEGAALEAAAASVGRAILISGLTVMVALAGLLITGQADFVSMGVGTIIVVLIAVLGSLTVLPAVLALLGDRVDRGRIPGYRWARNRRAAREAGAGRHVGAWAGLARLVTRRPQAALVVAVCVLGAIALPALQMHTAGLDANDLPHGLRIVRSTHSIERAFPGTPADAELVVVGRSLDTRTAGTELRALGQRGLTATGGRGEVTVSVARGGTVARVDVPLPDRSIGASERLVKTLRTAVAPTATRIPGVRTPALVTGDAADSLDYSSRMATATPEVIGFVLVLGFLLLLASFRAPLLAAAMIGLNLLSIGAAYGALVAVFQHTWAQQLLGFRSTGDVIDWLPLFMFVVLFGLSMDYTVLVLERIREARLAGRSPREAAAEGLAATAGTVTSAAVVMVGVFAVFGSLGVIDFKELGVGLAIAVLLDATLVRGIALPAVVTLLGERGWPLRRPGRAAVAAEWDDGAVRGTA
jgi:RND superfamily putative drug exporter